MQIALVSSSDTISDVLNKFVSLFCVNESEINSFTDSQYLALRSSICELKEIADFLLNKFTVDLDTPKRNSKVSLADWIARVLLSVREAANTSEAIAVQSVDTPPEPDPTSGLIISFGKTLEYLPQKSVTRRTWKDAHAQKFINAFNQNKLVKAFDKDIRYGGKQIGWCRLSCAPYKEMLCDMPSEDLLAEGGMCDTISEFVQQYFDSNPRLEVWVIRFDFMTNSVFAVETNPAVAADQATDSSTECPDCGYVHKPGQNTLCPGGEPKPEIIDTRPEIEVLEPEEKPVYTISIVADGAFSEERVNRLPPFLINREGYLLKKSWHRSYDAGYAEITSKHLSNIAVNSGLVIKLMAENLEVSQACIVGDPPPFIVNRGGVYKRDQVKRGLAVSYSQLVSEHLSNIVVV